jgi:hypothetical protein
MKTIYLQLISSLFTATLLVACGGGGDNGNNGSSANQTPPAAITGTNANALAKTSLFSNSTAGVNPAPVGSVTTDAALSSMIQTLSRLPHQFSITNTQAAQSALAVTTNPLRGSCGGTGSYSISVDSANGSFSGSLTFNSFDDCHGVINGSATFTGTVALSNALISLTSLSFTFTNLALGDTTATTTFNGTLTVGFPEVGSMFTMDMVATDNNGVSIRIENFAVQVIPVQLTTTNPAYYVIGTSGRFYQSQYGYIDVSTFTDIKIATGGGYPYAGVMLLKGANGIAGGPTRARLTFATANNYLLEVDSNGDGIYELTGGCNWADTCTLLTVPVINAVP